MRLFYSIKTLQHSSLYQHIVLVHLPNMDRKGTPALGSIMPLNASRKRTADRPLDDRPTRTKIDEGIQLLTLTTKDEPAEKPTCSKLRKFKNIPIYKACRETRSRLTVKHHYHKSTHIHARHLTIRGPKLKCTTSVNHPLTDLYRKWELCHSKYASELTNLLTQNLMRKDQWEQHNEEDQTELPKNSEEDELTYITHLVERCKINKEEEPQQEEC